MNKSPDAFRTISEVADDLDVPQHVLRFWETRFSPIRPLKRGGGRRYYRPDDVELLRGIRELLYGQGYTIKGVQRILKEGGPRSVQAIGRGDAAPAPPRFRPEPEETEFEESEAEAAGLFEEDAPASSPTRAAPAAAPPNYVIGGLSADDVARLRGALDDLVECERILGTLAAA
jgi:DNA-binding transcriptional MerR regulator